MTGGHGLPFEQTITIINHSGKIISTGKQLISIWKTAQASYKEKRNELKQERAAERAAEVVPERKIQRAQTFDQTRSIAYQQSRHVPDDDGRSRRAYDEESVASSRRSHRSSRTKDAPANRSQLALTESNLKTLSEVSSTPPSELPQSYRSPYAETMPGNGALSRLDLGRSEVRSIAPSEYTVPPLPNRTHSDGTVFAHRRAQKSIDMDLAYGNIPPDLEHRTDLDPKSEEYEAEDLVHKIENLLDEAHCAQHSATAMIKHLQERPDAAAAVALTLAELSAFLAKVSPSFMAFLKGGSPAVFALLSSPQFLIGTGIALGVTVVMFGGWKIVKRVAENEVPKQSMAFDTVPITQTLQREPEVDEAIVLEDMEEQLSSIETWRRGIVTDWEIESADQELMTPEADRATRERRGKDVADDDTRSQRSSKTHKSSKSHASHSSHKSHKSHHTKHEKDSSDKKSRRGDDDAASVASSRMSKRSSSSRKTELKAIDDGKSVKSEQLPFRSKTKVQNNNMLKALFSKKKAQSQAVLV